MTGPLFLTQWRDPFLWSFNEPVVNELMYSVSMDVSMSFAANVWEKIIKLKSKVRVCLEYWFHLSLLQFFYHQLQKRRVISASHTELVPFEWLRFTSNSSHRTGFNRCQTNLIITRDNNRFKKIIETSNFTLIVIGLSFYHTIIVGLHLNGLQIPNSAIPKNANISIQCKKNASTK